MRRLVIGIVVVALAAFLIKAFASFSSVTAANDSVGLAVSLKTPAGFSDAIGQRDCPVVDYCFRTAVPLQPMTQQNATTLIAQFGLTLTGIRCQSSSTAGMNGGLACTGDGDVTDSNDRTVHVLFSLVSGPKINLGSSSSPEFVSGIYAAFTTSSLKRLPLSVRFG